MNKSIKNKDSLEKKISWVRLSNGCMVSKYITVKELLDIVSFEEAQSVVKSLLNK